MTYVVVVMKIAAPPKKEAPSHEPPVPPFEEIATVRELIPAGASVDVPTRAVTAPLMTPPVVSVAVGACTSYVNAALTPAVCTLPARSVADERTT